MSRMKFEGLLENEFTLSDKYYEVRMEQILALLMSLLKTLY